jgi:hypothetical protein
VPGDTHRVVGAASLAKRRGQNVIGYFDRPPRGPLVVFDLLKPGAVADWVRRGLLPFLETGILRGKEAVNQLARSDRLVPPTMPALGDPLTEGLTAA